jgi:Cytochrome c554 and c-prime
MGIVLMSRTLAALGILLIAGLIAFGVLFGGCLKQPDGDPNRKLKSRKAKRPVPCKDWEKPAFALLLSGEQKGYLEPCGCTMENQLGGLAHRADLLRLLRKERNWDVAGLDLGGLLLRNRHQDRIKLQQTLKGLEQLGYVAVGLGASELPNNPDFLDYLLTMSNVLKDAAEVKLPFVSANVRMPPDDPLGPRQWHRFTVGGKTVAVTAVLGKYERAKILGAQTKNNQLAILDPEGALPKVISKMKAAKPDLMVLLAYSGLKNETPELVKKFPDFDLVLSAGGPEDGTPKPDKIGKTLIVNVGMKGKHVGVVGFYPDSKTERLKYELVELDAERFKDAPRMVALMKDYQQALRDELGPVFADMKFGPHPSGSRFAGADSCKDCHKKAYAVWIKSKHAQAYKSLSIGRPDTKGKWISRIHDPECLCCHTTGWDPQKVLRYNSGFLVKELAGTGANAKLYARLQGQQCENCHGPGSRHVEIETKWKADPKSVTDELLRSSRKEVQLTVETAKQRRLCYQCHDLDNSPLFDFDKYWEKVRHKGKD